LRGPEGGVAGGRGRAAGWVRRAGGAYCEAGFTRPTKQAVSASSRNAASPFTRRLDPRLLSEPAVAIQAVVPTLEGLARQTFQNLQAGLERRVESDGGQLELIALALGETRAYLQRLHTTPDQPGVWERHVSALHVLDHLDRLVGRARRAGPPTPLGVENLLARR